MNNNLQKDLTEILLLPHIDSILSDIRVFRKEIDQKLSKDETINKELKRWGKEYPIGLCAEIRNEMMDRLTKELGNPKHEGIKKLKDFVKAGGEIVPFWGVDDDKTFTNAIMLGDAVIDVANDTVSPYKNPVVFYPSVSSSPLKPIESFVKFAEVAEKYWNYDLYPNVYFPNLAPAYPVLAIVKAERDDGDKIDGLILPTEYVDLHERNLYTLDDKHLFGLASQFIFNSPYSSKRLPEQMLQSFEKNFIISTDPKDATEVFKSFTLPNENINLIPTQMSLKIKEMEQVGLKLKGKILAKIKR